uniref:Uncharacterized protein n=1 Tax=Amphora coffeiformis TaxID=265554 RepID=A0A7S3L694_9STRA|eukprot:scaffold8374_cov175-Amphora_coffeaeformis.AAC.78
MASVLLPPHNQMKKRRKITTWQTCLVLAGILSNTGKTEGRRPVFVDFSHAATERRKLPSIGFALTQTLRGGAETSGEHNEKKSQQTQNRDGATQPTPGFNSTLEKKTSTETAAAQDGDKKTAKEQTKKETAKQGDKDGFPPDEIDVPSLDTFINYDEGADALSSMAPVLETTTTHVLDAITHHEKQDKQNDEGDDENLGSIAEVPSSEEDDKEENEEEGSPDYDDEMSEVSMEAIPEDLTLNEAQEKSSMMRLEGKQLHDDADYTAAARAFRRAALFLETFVDETTECAEDWSTCRLHEALCCLKADDPGTAIVACTRVLDRTSTSGAVRARALYRRAKAYTGLEENQLALQDARAAAFLGDRRGVALYGQLMRESPAGSSSSSLTSSGSGGNRMMDDLASSSALFESLLNKSGSGPSTSEQADFNPMSLLSSMGGSPMLGGGKGMDTGGLAKSVITSLSKKIEDEATQDSICKYLQKTSGPQIRQYAGMAGLELPESQATKIANFLRKVTPKTIRKTVKNGKRLLYGVRLIRKTSKVISKYRNVLIWICVLAWAKSALLRPLPVNKRAARLAAKQAAKVA